MLLFAIPLGLFEVWLERFKSGWCGEFHNPFWGKKIRIKLLNLLGEKTYVTPYHLIMFGPVYLGVSIIELICLHFAGHGWMIITVSGFKIVPVIWLTAVWFGNATVEDFLWFVFNSYCFWFKFRFPDALKMLFRGKFTWHTRWVKIGSIMLPRFYLTTPLWVMLLLIIHYFVVHASLE